MALDKIVIMGAGTMGQGIARTIAETGTEVVLCDISEDVLKRSVEFLGDSLDREIEKWGITKSEKKAIMSRVKATTEFAPHVKKAKLVIEAIPENIDLKRELFASLDKLCPEPTIFISNTSTLSISQLASATTRPDKIIGMHFLNPVHKVPMVELVRGLKTSEATYKFTQDFAIRLNKKPIPVNEYPGFVTTRIIVPFLNEAMHVVMEGISTPEDIDNAMKLGFGFNMGPLALADMMGLDEVMAMMDNMLKELSEHKYNPCPLLRKMVRAGHLGVKTGQGFFRYDEEGNRIEGA